MLLGLFIVIKRSIAIEYKIRHISIAIEYKIRHIFPYFPCRACRAFFEEEVTTPNGNTLFVVLVNFLEGYGTRI